LARFNYQDLIPELICNDYFLKFVRFKASRCRHVFIVFNEQKHAEADIAYIDVDYERQLYCFKYNDVAAASCESNTNGNFARAEFSFVTYVTKCHENLPIGSKLIRGGQAQ
jgi:hypothetical protein